MSTREQVREFLTGRRARLSLADVRLPDYGGRRRVEGLRREEVALLAGVSADYYLRLERGNLAGVSESVLESLARALQLDEVERAHLFDLAQAANTSPSARRRVPTSRVRPNLQQILDSMSAPAWVRSPRSDVLATNRLGRALYGPLFETTGTPNTARFAFLDPRAREFYPDWDELATNTVATMRTQAGRTPYDKALTDLIGELCTRSEEFRVRWAEHEVRTHTAGTKRIHHPVVGELTLIYESMELTHDNGLVLVAYSTEPGSPSEQGLALLATWAATEDREKHARISAGQATE